MLSPDLKAAAQLAYQKFAKNSPEKLRGMTEEEFILRIEELERGLRSGLVKRSEYDERLTALLHSPDALVEVTTFTPPKRSTDQLLAELKQLHRDGILDDEEFEERKAELFFERNVEVDPDAPSDPAAEVEARKMKFRGYIEELEAAGVLDHPAAESARIRLDSLQ